MFTPPQGRASVGFRTSWAVGVPETPRAGSMQTCALTEDVKAKRNIRATNDLEIISTNNKERIRTRRIVAGYARGRDCEDLVLEREREAGDEIWEGPWPSFYTRAEDAQPLLSQMGQRNLL